jgi:WhiB family redox-sensing transcriptional regulator
VTAVPVFRTFLGELPRWMDRASCAGDSVDPDWWFPERSELGPEGAVAKAICQECPVRQPCLEFATAGRESGIWGGLTEQERKPPRRRRGLSGNHLTVVR